MRGYKTLTHVRATAATAKEKAAAILSKNKKKQMRTRIRKKNPHEYRNCALVLSQIDVFAHSF